MGTKWVAKGSKMGVESEVNVVRKVLIVPKIRDIERSICSQ